METPVDALPFIDHELDYPGMTDYVNNLVQEEMATFEPSDYLAHLPPPEFRGPTKFEPVAAAPEALEAPSSDDPEEWLAAIRAARLKLQHTRAEAENVELMTQNGSAVWLRHCAEVDALVDGHKARLAVVERQIEDVNRARKAAQESHAARLQALSHKWLETAAKNVHIEVACSVAEKQLSDWEHDAM